MGQSNNTVSSPASSSINWISRGPDRHFVVPTVDSSAIIVHDYKQSSDNTFSNQISASLNLDEKKGKQPPFVLSVDLPAHSLMEACPLLQQSMDYDLHEDSHSTCSRGSSVTLSNHNQAIPFMFPVLPHIRSSVIQSSMTSSTLLLQMEHERERGNLSHCLKLVQERKELEKELKKYTLESRSPVGEERPRQMFKAGSYRFSGNSRSTTLPHRHTLGRRARVSLSPSTFSLSSVHGEADSQVSSPTLTPDLDETTSPVSRSPNCPMTGAYSSTSSSLNASLLQVEEMGKLTLPHLSSEFRKHELAQAAQFGRDQSPKSSVFEIQTRDSQRQSSLNQKSIWRLQHQTDMPIAQPSQVTMPDTARNELGIWGVAVRNGYVEMSVDGPELEVSLKQPPLRPMLHQKIASYLERCEAISRKTTFSCHSPTSPILPEFCKTKLVTDGSQSWDIKHRSKSLDLKRQKAKFLTPNAWIGSLSQESNSLSARYLEPSSMVPRVSDSTENTLHMSSDVDNLCPRSSLEVHTELSYHDENESLADWPTAHPKLAPRGKGSLEEVLTARLPHSTDEEVLEIGGMEGRPDSGSGYSSYASSGRGSMEQAGGRFSLCGLTPVISSLPETVGRSLENMDMHMSLTDPNLRYKRNKTKWDKKTTTFLLKLVLANGSLFLVILYCILMNSKHYFGYEHFWNRTN